MFVGKGEGEGRGLVGVGQGFWLSLVARHEDLPWGMIICVVKLYKSSHNFQLPHSLLISALFYIGLDWKNAIWVGPCNPTFHLPYSRT